MKLEEQDQETIAIRSVVADAEKLQNDLEGFTRLLTQDVVIVNIAGRRVRGWDNVYEAYKQALETPLADVRTAQQVEDVRFLRPDVALVSLAKQVFDERESSSKDPNGPPPLQASLTFVLVKEQDRWRIASAKTTPLAT
jgi:uncharacterized protein (TIGR02246 family)